VSLPTLDLVHVCCTSSFAGVERHVSELAAAQADAGHRVTIVGGDTPRVCEVAGDAVAVLPGDRVPVALRSLRSLGSRPDVVNVHMTAAEVTLGLARWLRGVPVVSTRHFASPRGARRLGWPVVRLGMRRVTVQLAVSHYVADHVDGPSTVVLSGVRSDPGLVPAADRRPFVLVAQRLSPEKHNDVAVRAFAASGLAARGWRLEFAGKGAMRDKLSGLAQELGVADAVGFLGYRPDVLDLMREASVLLAPFPREAFGLSVVEAMARGLPVVAASEGGHLETLGVVSDASLFGSGDHAEAARLLLELADSAPARDAYGARLQSVQREQFTVVDQARRTDALYRELL
jgi:glycosyltransferase involved in cell wall biosynthesis